VQQKEREEQQDLNLGGADIYCGPAPLTIYKRHSALTAPSIRVQPLFLAYQWRRAFREHRIVLPCASLQAHSRISCATATIVRHDFTIQQSGLLARCNMQRPDIALRSGEDYRQLRAITILTFPFGVGLIIPYSVLLGAAFPAIGIAPMFFSTVLGTCMYTNLLRSPIKRAIIDWTLTMVYFSLLVPR